MRRLTVDFDEVQKAMEDTVRDAFDYFLDLKTGDVLILSEDILDRVRLLLSRHIDEDMENFEEVVFDHEILIPTWMEDEVELALDIFLGGDSYVRIPERSPRNVFAAMAEFIEHIQDAGLREGLRQLLSGQGTFRRFKDALEPYPKLRKLWYGYNAKAAKREIMEWLESLSIEAIAQRS
jgi:hypothetical protein